MKRTVSLIILCFLMLGLLCPMLSSCETVGGEEITLYVYNWGEYISDGSEGSLDVNAAFEEYCREKGMNVKVNYSTYSSNESMYAKIESGAASYDVIIPSDYMIQRMIKENLIQPLDMSKIPNYQYISEEFKGENVYYEDDTDNQYSVPYFYGMIGVIYNTSIIPEDEDSLGSWELMWDETYSGDILQFNNSRDAFGTALYYLGYDVNEATEEQWREALELLKTQKGIVQGYVMDEIFNKMEGGSAAVASYYAGDFLSMHENNEDLEFYYPSEGTNIYVDAMCIPTSSKSPDLAHEYINFMCSREIAVANAEYTYYASPLDTVISDEGYMETMSEVHEDAMNFLYGEHEFAREPQAYLNLPEASLKRLNVLWEELKMESSIGNGIYIGCGLIILALVVLVISHILKKRRWAKLYD